VIESSPEIHPAATGPRFLSDSDETLSPLVSSAAEPAGANCADGGTAISAGLDTDGDGVLTPTEVNSVTYVCGVAEGSGVAEVLGSLVATEEEPAGDNCEFGGIAISSGIDDDDDGTLAASEIDNTAYVCTPAAGTAEPLVPVLMAYTDEAPGTNCEFGGVLATSGADDNLNDELDSDEVDSSAYVCFPDAGSTSPDAFLAASTFVGGPTDECAGGYVSTVFGYDSDGDGELGAEEIVTTVGSCNARPSFVGRAFLIVEDCTSPITLDTGVVDVDGEIASLTVEVVSSGSELAPTIDDDGIITIPSGEHLGSATLSVTATDNFGSVRSASFAFRFDGEGCIPVTTFFGADPDTCVEIDVESLAGDDRGAITLIPGGFLYNGDNALIRVNRDLSSPTIVVREEIDTLIADVDAGRLFSLWSSDFAFTRLQDADGGLEGCCSTEPNFNQFVELNPDTFEVIGTVNLAVTVYGNTENGETHPLLVDDETIDFNSNGSALGLAADTLVVGTFGLDETNDRELIYFRVFDRETGALLSTFATNADDNIDFKLVEWNDQEADIISFFTVATPTGEVMTYRAEDNDEWVELNVRTGELNFTGTTFADDCDSESFALDAIRTTVFYHSEGSCFADSASEVVGYCSALSTENDGRFDDRGSRGGER
jgi:hypothetical protein